MYEKMDESRRFIVRFLWLRVQSIRRVWNEKYFPRIDVSFRTFPIQANNVHETMFREIFSALDYYKIIVYRSRLEGTRFIHVRYRTIKRIDALFLTERIHALRALHACTVSSRELDSTSWTNSSTRFPLSLSLFPTKENEQLSERTMLHYFRESVNPKRYFLKRNVRARIVIFFLKSGSSNEEKECRSPD